MLLVFKLRVVVLGCITFLTASFVRNLGCRKRFPEGSKMRKKGEKEKIERERNGAEEKDPN